MLRQAMEYDCVCGMHPLSALQKLVKTEPQQVRSCPQLSIYTSLMEYIKVLIAYYGSLLQFIV